MRRLDAITFAACSLFVACAIPGQISAQKGQFVVFDPPRSFATYPRAINPAGVITGESYESGSNGPRGFVRAADGTITIFDVPGSLNATVPNSINPEGSITGAYNGTDYGSHSFIRASDGTFATFDPPDALNSSATGINPAGTVTGGY